MSTTKSFSWAAATAVEISQHCGLENLPLNLIEQVLPRFRAFLKESKHPACPNSCEPSPAPIPATVIGNASTVHQNPLPPSVEGPKLLHDLQLLSSFSTSEQPTLLPLMEHLATAPTSMVPASAAAPTVLGPWTELADVPQWFSMTDGFTWAPETVPTTAGAPPTTETPSEARQPSVRTLTHEELEALLQEQDGAGLEQTTEEGPSAALEFLDLEYGRMVEAGLGEYPLALPTHEDVEGSLFLPPSTTDSSTELAQGASMGGIETGGFDFGHLLDGWEGWAELGCPDKM